MTLAQLEQARKDEAFHTVCDAHKQLLLAVATLSIDGHVYGSRPCPTCAKMTQAIGEPFGCDYFRKERNT